MTTKDVLERIARALEGRREREIMNTEEAAEYLGVSDAFLEKLKSAYAVPFARIGGRVVYRKRDLEKYLDGVTVRRPEDDPGRQGVDYGRRRGSGGPAARVGGTADGARRSVSNQNHKLDLVVHDGGAE